MNDEEFAILIDRGTELRNVEYKRSGAISDKHFLYRVVRAILGMTNRQDGGYVVIGVTETNNLLQPVGIDASVITGWTRDSLADKVASLVDPSVEFDVEHRGFDGRQFVLITVREFDDTPVFCRTTVKAADSPNIVLREGALYVRSRRKPETIEIRTSQEMRDLLDLALQKRLRRFYELTQAGGLQATPASILSDADQFERQLSDLGIG